MAESSLGRLVGALVSPVGTFRSIAERPTWAVAMAVLVLAAVVTNWVAAPRIDWAEETREAFERRGGGSEGEIEQAVEIQERFGKWIAIAGVAIGGPIVYLVIALVFWVVLRMLGGDFGYPSSLAVTVHGFMPFALAAFLSLPIIFSRPELSAAELQRGLLASNLSFLAGEEPSRPLVALLASLDLFSFWSLALLAIGYAAVGRLSRSTAGTAVGVLWGLFVLGKVGLAAIF